MIYNKYINIRLLTKLVYTFVAAFVLFLSGCSRKKTLFELLPSTKTNIHFNNKVIEDDKYNVLEYMNIYTGAGPVCFASPVLPQYAVRSGWRHQTIPQICGCPYCTADQWLSSMRPRDQRV